MKIEINPVETSSSKSFDEECTKRNYFIYKLYVTLNQFFPDVKDISYISRKTNEWLIIEYADGGEIRELINGYSLPRIMSKIVEHLR